MQEIIAAAIVELGRPAIDKRVLGSRFILWRLADGEGAWILRLSGREIQKGHTVLGQIQSLRYLSERERVRPGFIVLTLENSASDRFEQRPDCLWIEQEIGEGNIPWIAARGIDRLVRNDLARAMLLDLLRRNEVKLYLSELGRAVDWNSGSDTILLQVKGSFAEQESVVVRERTRAGVFNGRVSQGTGRPGALKFGFYYDPESRTVCCDADQLKARRRMHELYQTHSVRQVRDILAEEGWPFAVGTLYYYLRDPTPTTGEWSVTWDGWRVAQKRIDIPEDLRVPESLFAATQRKLSMQRGKNTRTPVGSFALNGLLYHAPCIGTTVKCGNQKTDGSLPDRPVSLVGSNVGGGNEVPRYRHCPLAPKSCGRGCTFRQDEIEPAVVQVLRQLARSRILQEEWAQRCPAVLDPGADEASVVELRAQIDEQQAEVEAIRNRRATPATPEAKLDDDAYLELILPKTRALAKLERKLRARENGRTRKADLSINTPVLRDLARSSELEDSELLSDLQDALDEILTDLPPEDPDLRIRRAAVMQAALSKVVVHETKAGLELELFGPLVPPDFTAVELAVNPVSASRSVLEAAGTSRTWHGESSAMDPVAEPFNKSPRVEQFGNDGADANRANAIDWTEAMPVLGATVGSSARPPSSRRGRVDTGSWAPLWHSTRQPVARLSVARWTFERCFRAVVEEAAQFPAGQELSVTRWRKASLGQGYLPSETTIQHRASELGKTSSWFFSQANRAARRLREVRSA